MVKTRDFFSKFLILANLVEFKLEKQKFPNVFKNLTPTCRGMAPGASHHFSTPNSMVLNLFIFKMAQMKNSMRK
jgi:hypothetical protein